MAKRRKYYSIWNFCWDLIMLCATGGLWIIWIIIREAQLH